MPRKRTIELDEYQFDELDDHAKERARDWYREGALDYDWWDCTFDDAKRVLAMLGFDVRDIYFSGFCSQGDGACFTGYWYARNYRPGKASAECPTDTTIADLDKRLGEIVQAYPDSSACSTHTGRYSHSHSTTIDADIVLDEDEDELIASVRDIRRGMNTDEASEELTDIFRDAMDWIYKNLEAEYDYLNSDEQVDESIRANEYTFNEDGSRA